MKRRLIFIIKLGVFFVSSGVLFLIFIDQKYLYVNLVMGIAIVMMFFYDRVLKNCLKEEREKSVDSILYSVNIKQRLWLEFGVVMLVSLFFIYWLEGLFAEILIYLILLRVCRLISKLWQIKEGVFFILVDGTGILEYGEDVRIFEFKEMNSIRLRGQIVIMNFALFWTDKLYLNSSPEELNLLREELGKKAPSIFARF